MINAKDANKHLLEEYGTLDELLHIIELNILHSINTYKVNFIVIRNDGNIQLFNKMSYYQDLLTPQLTALGYKVKAPSQENYHTRWEISW